MTRLYFSSHTTHRFCEYLQFCILHSFSYLYNVPFVSIAEAEPHYFGGDGDVTRCGSGSDGSKRDVQHG
jgi:hypothetical protein